MKYLPILQELFESDTLVIFIIGLAVSVIIGLHMKNKRKIATAIACSLGIYIVCELISNIRSNFMTEIILLFLGTMAIGAVIGFCVSILIKAIKN